MFSNRKLFDAQICDFVSRFFAVSASISSSFSCELCFFIQKTVKLNFVHVLAAVRVKTIYDPRILCDKYTEGNHVTGAQTTYKLQAQPKVSRVFMFSCFFLSSFIKKFERETKIFKR